MTGLLTDTTDPETLAYLEKAAGFVDVALGPSWRGG